MHNWMGLCVFWQTAEAHLRQENVKSITQHNQILRKQNNLESMETFIEKYLVLGKLHTQSKLSITLSKWELFFPREHTVYCIGQAREIKYDITDQVLK